MDGGPSQSDTPAIHESLKDLHSKVNTNVAEIARNRKQINCMRGRISDQDRRNHGRTLVVSGDSLEISEPPYLPQAKKCVELISGISIEESLVQDCHPSKNKKKLFVKFIKEGDFSQLNRIMANRNKAKMDSLGIYLSRHQAPFDANIAYHLRKLKKSGVIRAIGTGKNGVNRVLKEKK